MRKAHITVVALLLSSLSMPTLAGNSKNPEMMVNAEQLPPLVNHAVVLHLFPNNEINEEYNIRTLDKIYENFLCEGVVYTTYTQSNGMFYKNQKRMF